MECLETNKICSEQNRKCKECKLDDCRRTLAMIETQEQRIERKKLRLIKEQLPKQCRNCSFLEIINIDKQILHCPYMINNECVIGETKL